MRLLVVGAGGHAKVVIDAARLAGFEVVAAVGRDGDPAELMGVRVVRRGDPVDADAFIAAIGNNKTRAEAYAGYRELGMTAATVVHPSAIVSPEASLGAGTFLAAGAIVNVHARIGENAILNTGCKVDHDVVIGDHAHIGPNVALCGGVRIGEGVLMGVGSSVIPMAEVGEWSVVGAGAAVVDDLAGGTVFAGVPAVAIGKTGELS